MKISLTKERKAELELQHKKERDRRVADRIKAVLLYSEGWSHVEISQALRIWPETVHDHLQSFAISEKLKPENGGSESRLSSDETSNLVKYLDNHPYTKVSDICSYVQETYGHCFTVSGMTKWLHRHGFTYKKPKGTPYKADPAKQASFMEY